MVDYGKRSFLKSCIKLASGLFIAPSIVIPTTKEVVEAQGLNLQDLPFNAKNTSGGSLPPLPQLSNLLGYWESSDFDGSSNNTSVTAWVDKNGGGSTTQWNQRSSNFGPLVDTGTKLNGHNTLKFQAAGSPTAQLGMKSGGTFIPASGITGAELWMIFKNINDPPPASPGTNPLFMFNSSDTQENEQPYTDGHFYDGTFRTGRNNQGAPGVNTASSFVLYRLSANSGGTSLKAYINDTNFYTNVSYTFQSRGTESSYSLGWNDPVITGSSPGPYGSMNIAGLYMWKVQFAAGDVTQGNSYMNAKWGLSL